MKFNCGYRLSKKERNEAILPSLKNWHKWFAWYPIHIDSQTCVWLETIERSFPDAFVGECWGSLYLRNPKYRLPE